MRYQTAPRPEMTLGAGLYRDGARAGTGTKRVTGIEPALGAWKAPVQPVHLTRALYRCRLYGRPGDARPLRPERRGN